MECRWVEVLNRAWRFYVRGVGGFDWSVEGLRTRCWRFSGATGRPLSVLVLPMMFVCQDHVDEDVVVLVRVKAFQMKLQHRKHASKKNA